VKIIYTAKALQKWKCDREEIDLYHGTNFRLRGRGKKGNVVTIHDLAFKRYPQFLKKNFGNYLSFLKTKRDVRMADRVIAVSQHTAKDIVEFFKIDSQRVKIIYHGVESHFRPDVPRESIGAVKKKYGIATPDYILWVGTIEPRKNLQALIRMYGQLKNIHATCSLVLGGGLGWKYENVLPLVQSLGEKVRITGYLPREDLIPLYAGAHLFVYPSLYEGFGMPLLEAMASGVPIVAARTSSIPEVIGDAGLLMDPSNRTEMEEAVMKGLLDSSLRDSLKEKGIQRAKKFTWERAAMETLKVYQEVVDRQGNENTDH
jgi:glycosyltransferase involved in cell wall biosynthesis